MASSWCQASSAASKFTQMGDLWSLYPLGDPGWLGHHLSHALFLRICLRKPDHAVTACVASQTSLVPERFWNAGLRLKAGLDRQRRPVPSARLSQQQLWLDHRWRTADLLIKYRVIPGPCPAYAPGRESHDQCIRTSQLAQWPIQCMSSWLTLGATHRNPRADAPVSESAYYRQCDSAPASNLSCGRCTR